MPRYPRAARLHGAAAFRRVFRSGRRFRAALFNIYATQSPAATSRLGLAVSKRTLTRAVDRNRLKRLIRESFRAHAAALPAVDLIVQSTPAVRTASATAVREALGQLWERVMLGCPTTDKPD